ncbi:uncharacterized protein F5891DRAFT_1003450 [Suillus fuscotomentosus]|uniref:FAD/NAD(P)-binding domain-containing protein n=1 Tax=Suillus fuscotomentosus TaxID=1912939 RepID=A0AAD4EIG7_9AGAM|nr:uncharacterized protein F5891DRAFT_1003450 [Suillus fuscotomentosus]KAG1906692.1 hypothetical protein F5891DRAFT_1003450 [Suillus fuscotomentosus]
MIDCLQRRVAIIGAGVGGLSQAIALKTKLGFHDFTIFEKASEVGGAWRGCSSDVQIHWYSLSSDLYPYWNKSHGLQPEIQAYWIDLSKKYNLYPHIAISSVAHVVISAVGILDAPRIPYEIPGVRKFQGVSFHSAQWPGSIDLRNKRVAVIGNASSGAQFVPSVSEDPSVEVVNFIRTPTWFTTRPHIPYSDTEKWIFANIPLAMRLHRAWIVFWFELHLIIRPSDRTLKKRREAMTKYILNKAPSRYHDRMIPDYLPGCKRTVANSGFLDVLHRPNLTLNFDGIDNIAENGIITKTGEMLPFDVIVYATGFISDRYPMHVRGSNEATIQGYYDAHGGPTAYLGTAVPDIPNFYLLAGPNTGIPASTLFMEEVQVGYIHQLIEPVLSGSASSFTVEASHTDEYNAKVQERISRSVFMQCHSWARMNGTGKVYNPFPWAMTRWWLLLRKPNWDHYVAVGAEKWVRARRRKFVKNSLKCAAILTLLCSYIGSSV